MFLCCGPTPTCCFVHYVCVKIKRHTKTNRLLAKILSHFCAAAFCMTKKIKDDSKMRSFIPLVVNKTNP